MPIKEVSCYKTSDGQLFEDKELALKHETELSFDEWYVTNRLFTAYHEPVGIKNIKEWIKRHAAVLEKYLEAIRKDE